MRDFIDDDMISPNTRTRSGIDTEMDNVMFVPIDLDSDSEIEPQSNVLQGILNLFSSCLPIGCLPSDCLFSDCLASSCLTSDSSVNRTAQEDLRDIAKSLIQSEPHYQEVREIRIQIDSRHVIQQIILNRNTHLFYNRRSFPELKSIIDTWFHQNNTEFVANDKLFTDLESYYAEIRGRLKRFNWYGDFTGGWIKFTKSTDGKMKPCGFRHSYSLEPAETIETSETSEE